MKTLEAGERREAIRQILEHEEITRQQELLDRLTQRGFKVAQSSISRDLQAIGILKVGGRYMASAALSADVEKLQPAGKVIESVRAAGPHLLVMHTPPGQAAVIALAIDHAKWPEVVGTVAGDDTVFLATSSRSDQTIVEARLSGLIATSE